MILMLIICLLWLLFITKNNIIRMAIVLFFLFWQGIPAYNKWQADKLVDELCAKDGGIKVYETVTLPKDRFNQWGQFIIHFKGYAKPSDEYFMINQYKTIAETKNHAGYTSFYPVISQYKITVFRNADIKKMGEGISYSRGGGDPIGPWMGSSYTCPNYVESELNKNIFLINKSVN